MPKSRPNDRVGKSIVSARGREPFSGTNRRLNTNSIDDDCRLPDTATNGPETCDGRIKIRGCGHKMRNNPMQRAIRADFAPSPLRHIQVSAYIES